MKALTFNPNTDTFAVCDIPVPEPAPDDVLVKVDACALNPVDAKIMFWKTMVPDMGEGWVPGLDVSGHIEKVGAKVHDWQPGDRVLYHGNMFRPCGGFAEFALHRAATLVPHPDLSDTEAASTPCAGWTAWRALVDKLRIQETDALFIAGGSGGVGGFAIQIAAHFGLAPIIASCSAKNKNYVLGLGATHAIDYTREDVTEQVLSITAGKGVTKGLDAVGGDNDILIANALGFEGEMVALVDALRPAVYENASMRALSFHYFSLGAAHLNGRPAEARLKSAGETFSRLVENGRIDAPLLQVISLEDTGRALTKMLNQRTVGKIIMKI